MWLVGLSCGLWLRPVRQIVVLRVVLRVRQIVFPRAVLPLVAYGVPRGVFLRRSFVVFYEL